MLYDGEQLRRDRNKLDLNMTELGRAVGMTGSAKNMNNAIGRYERGTMKVPTKIKLLVECFLLGARPSSWPE